LVRGQSWASRAPGTKYGGGEAAATVAVIFFLIVLRIVNGEGE